MPDPTFDKSNGWWYILWRDAGGVRNKQPLMRDPRWKGKDHKLAKPPPEVVLVARKYQDMESQARHGVDVGKARPVELGPELAAYRASYASTHPKSSTLVLDRALANFREFLAGGRVTTLAGVGVVHCRQYLESRHRQGRAHATITVEKRMLGAIWARARSEGRVASNPWQDARVPGKPPDSPPKFWTQDELGRILAITPGWLKDLVLLGVNCGGRITSLLQLRAGDADFDRGFIGLRSKTGRYEVPMSPVAREVLWRRQSLGRDGWLFPSPRTAGHIKSVTTYARLGAIARKAGVPPKGSYNHILRHTFASHALMGGVALSTVSKWLGHSSINMTMRYSHLCQDESRRAMDSFSLGLPRGDQGSSGG